VTCSFFFPSPLLPFPAFISQPRDPFFPAPVFSPADFEPPLISWAWQRLRFPFLPPHFDPRWAVPRCCGLLSRRPCHVYVFCKLELNPLAAPSFLLPQCHTAPFSYVSTLSSFVSKSLSPGRHVACRLRVPDALLTRQISLPRNLVNNHPSPPPRKLRPFHCRIRSIYDNLRHPSIPSTDLCHVGTSPSTLPLQVGNLGFPLLTPSPPPVLRIAHPSFPTALLFVSHLTRV